MMRVTLSICVVLLLLTAATVPLWAHHAFEAEFDQKRPVHRAPPALFGTESGMAEGRSTRPASASTMEM